MEWRILDVSILEGLGRTTSSPMIKSKMTVPFSHSGSTAYSTLGLVIYK